MREEKKAAPVAPAQEAGEQPLPMLVRDIAADLSTTPIQVCKALADLGFGSHSVNMVVTPQMAKSLRAHFAATAQAAPSAVEGPSERVAFEMWVRKSTTEVPHRDQYGFYDEPVSEWWKVWQARAAAPTTQAAPQQEPVAWRHSKTLCLYETKAEVPLSDGDEWAEPLYLAAPVAQGDVLTYEQSYAIRQGHEIASSDAYFEARPQIDNNDRRGVFRAGFDRGWDAARAQAKEGSA